MRNRILRASFIIGFEGLQRVVDPDGFATLETYPHYSIERWPKTAQQQERLRLILAVAGFSADQVEIMVADSHLVVSGDQKSEPETRNFLHRGIAARRFQRVFRLAEGLHVARADLAYGLLSIDLVRRTTESLVKIIRIEPRDVSSVA